MTINLHGKGCILKTLRHVTATHAHRYAILKDEQVLINMRVTAPLQELKEITCESK